MRLRGTSIRVRVFLLVLIPLFALAGVYSYAVAGQFGTAVGLSNAGKVAGATITPLSKLLVTLNTERSLAAGYLSTGSASLLDEYQAQTAVTDRAVQSVEDVSASGPVTANASSLERAAAARFLSDTQTLPSLRDSIIGRSISPYAAIRQYSVTVTDGIQVIAQSLQESYVSQSLAATSREEVNLYESEMLVLEENDVYTAAILTGRLTASAQLTFGQLVSVRRYLVQEAVPQLDPVAAALYRQYVPSGLSLALASLEDSVTAARSGGRPPVPLAQWQGTVKAYATNLEVMLTKGPNWIQSQVTSSARSALTTLIVAASLGLLAVVASVLYSVVMGHRLVRRLVSLRASALALAHEQLPNLMARLRAGERVDVDAEAPSAAAGAEETDELDQVRQAFTVVHRTAVAAAVDEANLRRGVNEVFRNLARRSQVLLQRQLVLLDAMERRAEEPGQLEDLFRIDHLTTRMRRHAEGLIILSGESSGRNWRDPVPFVDVIRAAVAEVEDYPRVTVESRSKSYLSGRAVADVIHLLAELIENATVFSPPAAPVRVRGQRVGQGFAVEVEDDGLGIPAPRLAEINRDLASLPDFDLTGSDRLGLFITGRLAHRHGIQVTLGPSASGGVSAVVTIPRWLTETENGEVAVAGGGDGQRPARPRAALYGGTSDATVAVPPRTGRPAPGWWAAQRTPGRHAAGGEDAPEQEQRA